MTNPDTPKDGDFAAYLAGKATQRPGERLAAARTARSEQQAPPSDLAPSASRPQTIEDVLAHGQEPTDEFIETFVALEGAEPLSDEELAQQALEHPGDDGDPRTPE